MRIPLAYQGNTFLPTATVQLACACNVPQTRFKLLLHTD
jgi:hypothetical protein